MERNTVPSTSGDTGNKLINLIRTVALNVLKQALKGYPRSWSAKVVETSGSISTDSFADVYLNGDSTQPSVSMKNKSFQTLNANDEVILFSPSGSLTDAFVQHKK